MGYCTRSQEPWSLELELRMKQQVHVAWCRGVIGGSWSLWSFWCVVGWNFLFVSGDRGIVGWLRGIVSWGRYVIGGGGGIVGGGWCLSRFLSLWCIICWGFVAASILGRGKAKKTEKRDELHPGFFKYRQDLSNSKIALTEGAGLQCVWSNGSKS